MKVGLNVYKVKKEMCDVSRFESGFDLIEIYNELSNYVISVLRNHHHSNAAKVPELIGALVKLYQCIKEE